MPYIGVHADPERAQKRWILGALAIALVAHAILAWLLGWYRIPNLAIPYTHPPASFSIKTIEIDPDQFKSRQQDPISHLPMAEPPNNPAQFNLDPNLVEKVLQMPQPTLSAPSVPDPGKVIAAADLTQGLPYAEADTATVTAEISKVEPAAASGSQAASQLANDLISANTGPAQAGTPAGTVATGNGTNGKLPGFSELAPGFRASDLNLTRLPEPVLLRLPSDVLFDFDSAHLKPQADPLLSQAIALITKYPQADIQIDGYSDSIGRSDYNLNLSQQRAQAVQAWLQDHIIQAAYQFRSQGHGSADYVVSPQGTIDQQQPNRRVEILIQALKP